jgi:hypothetical protein
MIFSFAKGGWRGGQGMWCFLFWVIDDFLTHFFCSLQGGCGGSKRVSIFSLAWVGHMYVQNTWRKLLFWFIYKVIVKVQRSCILFTYTGAPHVQKTRGSCSSLSNFYQPFPWVHCFLFMSFCFSLFSYCFLFFVLWRDRELHAQCKYNLSSAWRFKKFWFFP